MKKNLLIASLAILLAGIVFSCSSRGKYFSPSCGIIKDEEELVVPPNDHVVVNDELLHNEPGGYIIQFCPGDGVKCEGEVVIGGKKYSYAGTKSLGSKDYLIVY